MGEQNLWNFGPFRLDVRNEQLWREHEVLRLTNKALAVLRYLVEHQGQLVTKDDLFAAVWPEVIVSDAALVVCIRELRQTLGDERRTPQFIETVHGRGYRFVASLNTTQPVQGSTFQVQKEDERQKPALSLAEGANSENGLESSVQSLESNGQGLASSAQSLESEGQKRVVIAQTLDPRLSDSELTNPTSHPLDTPAPLPQRSLSGRSLVFLGLVLVVGIVVAVHNFSLPPPALQPPPCPTSPRSSCCRL